MRSEHFTVVLALMLALGDFWAVADDGQRYGDALRSSPCRNSGGSRHPKGARHRIFGDYVDQFHGRLQLQPVEAGTLSGWSETARVR
jgi:hypothetical protein